MTGPPVNAAPPQPGAGAEDEILLGGGDQEDFTPVTVILADLHELLDGKRNFTGWNERARHEAELRAWRAGSKRICDLVGVD